MPVAVRGNWCEGDARVHQAGGLAEWSSGTSESRPIRTRPLVRTYQPSSNGWLMSWRRYASSSVRQARFLPSSDDPHLILREYLERSSNPRGSSAVPIPDRCSWSTETGIGWHTAPE